MKIPKRIRKNKQKYVFEKEYENFIMYRNIVTGVRECFTKLDIKSISKRRKQDQIGSSKVER